MSALVAQRLKGLPSTRETWVQSLGLEDPLEKEMATHSSILAWRIPRGHKELGMTEQLHFHFIYIQFANNRKSRGHSLKKEAVVLNFGLLIILFFTCDYNKAFLKKFKILKRIYENI